jgi:hypothetical protein
MVFNSDKVRSKDQFKQLEKSQIKSDLKNAGYIKDDISVVLDDYSNYINPRNESMIWYQKYIYQEAFAPLPTKKDLVRF